MITLGLAALTWYYAHALTRQSRSRQAAQSTAVSRAQGEMPLPSLGRIEPPLLPGAPTGNVEPAPAAAPQLPPELPLEQARVRATSPNPDSGAPAAPANTHRQRALERRLAGTVFARESQSSATTPAVVVRGPDHWREDG
jgi:type IV secretion system protein VirB10